MKVNKEILTMIVRKNSPFEGGQGDVFNHNLKQSFIFFLMLSFSFFTSAIAQEDKEKQEVLRQSEEMLSKANSEMLEGKFSIAEADYRQAISLNPKDDTAKYNLGNAYYNKEMNDIAMNRFKQAASVADSKADKHKAFHNLGNTYMNEKKYQEAVDSYKNALRNNPKDEETRYNLALAKELLEDQQKNGGGGDDNKDQDDKKEENKDKQENENNKKDGEDGEDKKEEDKGDEEQDKKEGDKDKDKGKPDEPKEDKQEQEPQQQQPGKLSPQQVKNLLEAMNNEEKKVQDKINAKKQKGAKVKSAKDW